MTDKLLKFVHIARNMGLSEVDVNIAIDYLEHNEFGLCLDTIATQLYEYDVEINHEFYELMLLLLKKMHLSYDDYSYMKELIRDENNIPKSVKDELSKIIVSLR